MLKYAIRVCVASLLAVSTLSFAQKSGADTYKAKCQSCHGADGSGNTPAGKSMKAKPFNSPDIVSASDADLIADTKKWKRQDARVRGQTYGRSDKRCRRVHSYASEEIEAKRS